MTLKKEEVVDGESPFIEFESFDQVPPEYINKGIKDTMFTNNYDESIKS